MPKTFAELRAGRLALEKQRDGEVAAVEKKFEPELTKAGQLLVAACDHALVVEERVEKYHSPHEIHIDFSGDPLSRTEPLMRICCLCSYVETADHLTKEFKTLTTEPFRYFCFLERRMFVPTAMEYCHMPLSKLRKEAALLRKKGGE